MRLEPVLVPRDRERSDQPQTTRASAKRRPKIKPSGMERATAPRGARPKRQAKGDAKTAQRVVAE